REVALDRLGAGAALAPRVALHADLERQIEDDADRRHVRPPREREQGPPRLRRDVRRVDHRQAPAAQAPLDDRVEDVEGVAGRALIPLVVGDERPAAIRRDDLGLAEVARRKGRLARAGGSDEDDQRELGDGEAAGHFVSVRRGARGSGGTTPGTSTPYACSLGPTPRSATRPASG